jgi:hypothetical protein
MAIRPSLRFAMLLLLFHLLAAIVVCVTAMPPTARFLALPAILLSLIYYLARDVLLLFPNSWHEMLLDQSGVSIAKRNGVVIHGSVANKTVVNPFFVLLHIRFEGRSMPVSRVIFPDALDVGLFRELCVHLRFALPVV